LGVAESANVFGCIVRGRVVKGYGVAVHAAEECVQLHAGIVRKNGGAELLPVAWSDNYVSLLPGESREITAQFFSYDALFGDFDIRLTGWNIDLTTVPLTRLQGAFGGSGVSH